MKKKHAAGPGGVNLGLIVTPMLDMSFQLLAFFIMVYHPAALEGHIEGKLLPPSAYATKGPKGPDTPSLEPLPAVDAPPELEDAILVQVKAVGKGQVEGDRTEGQPSRLQIIRPDAAGEPQIIAGSEVTLKEGLVSLEKELRRLYLEAHPEAADPGAAKKKDTVIRAKIKLEGDADLKHEFMMRVYDVCKRAGYDEIAFVAPKMTGGR